MAERGLPAQLAGAIDGHLARFAEHTREGLLAASTAVGLEVMAEMMEAEVTALADVKGRHNPERTHTRHGTERGSVTLGGRRLPITRPRVRTVGDDAEEGHAELLRHLRGGGSAVRAGHRPDAGRDLDAQVPDRARTGRRSRRTGRDLDVEVGGLTPVVTATAERLAELCARPLGDRRWPIVMLDGVHLGEHLLVVALGVTDDGTKVPLGVVEGSTENAHVCDRLVADLAGRGLDTSYVVLFVVDGARR
jgi:putative transposase